MRAAEDGGTDWARKQLVEFVTREVAKTLREVSVSLENGPDLVVHSIDRVICQLHKHGGGELWGDELKDFFHFKVLVGRESGTGRGATKALVPRLKGIPDMGTKGGAGVDYGLL